MLQVIDTGECFILIVHKIARKAANRITVIVRKIATTIHDQTATVLRLQIQHINRQEQGEVNCF